MACNIVNDVTLNNNDNFWKKAQIFCQIIQGKEDDALFEAELLKASGSQDENFFNLLYSMTQQNENFLIDESNLNLLDIAMMDQIRNIIPNEFIFKTPKYNYSALLNIENIQPETKAFMVDELLKKRSISINETEFYYNIIGDSSLQFDEALNNLKLNSGPQSRADIWNTLKNNKDNENINTNILAVIENELANGRSIQSLSLFVNLFKFSDNVSDSNNFRAREIKVIYDVFNGREFQEIDGVDTQFLEDLFLLSPNQELSLDKMIEYNIQDSIQILKLFNITVSQGDYLDLFLNGNINTLSNENNTLLKMALSRNPDFILTLDGDEVLMPNSKQRLFYELNVLYPNVNLFEFKELYVWDKPNQYRCDGIFNNTWSKKLFRLKDQPKNLQFGGTDFPGNAHCAAFPNNLIGKNQPVRSKIKILHYGYYDEELRKRKYDFLTKLDPNNIDFDGYKHIHSGNSKFAGPDGMEFRSIPELDLQN